MIQIWRRIVINPDLFPKILIRSVDVECVTIDNTIHDNPHVREDVIRRRTKNKKRFQEVAVNQRETFQESDILNIDVVTSFEGNQSSTVIGNFIDKDFINKYLRIRIMLFDNISMMVNFIDKFDDLSVTKLDSLQEQGVINTSVHNVADIDFEADAGEEVVDNIIRATFKYPNLNPEYLAVAAFSYFDILEMERDLGLDLASNEELKSASSTLTIENLFVNGNLVSETFVFRDIEGRIYSGPVRASKGAYYKYGTNEVLEPTGIPNNVVTDLRSIKDLQSINLDLVQLQQTLETKFDTVSIYNRISRPRTRYFTDLCLTQDKNANSRMAFGINYKDIIINEGRYGFLFKDRDKFREQSLYKLSKIIDISVYRQRVDEIKRDNRLGAQINDIEYFEEKRKPVLISNNSEEQYKSFPRKEFTAINNTSGDINSIIREIDINLQDIRMFTLSDEELDKVTDGLYTYLVEIEIEDPTIKFVNNLYKSVERFANFIDEYLCKAEIGGNFNWKTGKLDRSLILQLQEDLQFNWNGEVIKFITALSFIFPDLPNDIYDIIKSIVNPISATVYSLNTLKKIVNSFLSYLQIQFRDNTYIRNFSSSKKVYGTNRRASSDYAVIKISKEYTSPVVDSNLIKNKGIEYIEYIDVNDSVEYDNFDGLAAVRLEDLLRRGEIENRKYFGANNTSIDILNSNKTYLSGESTERNMLSFFSPSSIKFAKDRETLLNTTNAFDPIRVSLLELQSSNAERLVVDNFDKAKSTINSEENLLNRQGVNYLRSFGAKFVESEIEPTVKTEDVLDKLKSESFITDNKTDSAEEEEDVVAGTSVFKSAIRVLGSEQNLTLSETEVRNTSFGNHVQEINNFDMTSPLNKIDRIGLSGDAIRELPNQHKSLLMGSTGASNVNNNLFVRDSGLNKEVDETNYATFRLNYQKLSKVDALVGFEESSTGHIIGAPKWEKLSKQLVDNYPHKEILCRLQEYNGPLTTKEKDGFEKLPVYNSYFILILQSSEQEDVLEELQMEQEEAERRGTVTPASLSNSGVFILDA